MECRVDRVNYEVDMADRSKRKRIFHVNMLHKWYATTAAAYWVEEGDPEEVDDVPVWDTRAGRGGQPTVGQQLSDGQTEELQTLLCQFADVLQDKLGRTHSWNTQLTQVQLHPHARLHTVYHMPTGTPCKQNSDRCWKRASLYIK